MKKRRSISQEADSLPPSLWCSSLRAVPFVSAPFPSLVLILIVLGAALYGWGMGCWLGLVFGAVVLLWGMPASFWRQIREGPL